MKKYTNTIIAIMMFAILSVSTMVSCDPDLLPDVDNPVTKITLSAPSWTHSAGSGTEGNIKKKFTDQSPITVGIHFPKLVWTGVQSDTKSLLLILQKKEDTDYLHGIWIIDSTLSEISEKAGNVASTGFAKSPSVATSDGKVYAVEEYVPPNSTSGNGTYVFKIFAMSLTKEALKAKLEDATDGYKYKGSGTRYGANTDGTNTGGESRHANQIEKIKTDFADSIISSVEVTGVFDTGDLTN